MRFLGSLSSSLAYFLLATCTTVLSQQPVAPAPAKPDQTYSLKIDTKLVLLDVVVTDRDGKLVTNLTRDDFRVFEDKEPQTIRTLDKPFSQTLPAHAKVASTEELDRMAPNAPVSIIVLDELVTKDKDKAFSLWSLKRYLNGEGDELTQPTMLVAANPQRFMVLHDYTTSKKEILNALERHYAGSLWLTLANTDKTAQVNAALGSMMRIAEATSGHPGHKNVIWIGRGFPEINVQDELDPENHLLESVRACTNMLMASRVTLYTVDPEGVASGFEHRMDESLVNGHGSPGGDPFKSYINFESMAWASGGRAYYGRNDVDTLIGTSVRDGQSFYTLSYRPTSTSDDPKDFRKIRVEMTNKYLTATTREGYYAGAAPATPMRNDDGQFNKRFLFDVATATKGLLVYDGVPMTITRDATNPDRFTVHVKAADLDWEQTDPPKQRAELTLIVESHDINGKLLEHSARVLHANALGSANGGPPTGTIDLPPLTVASADPVARIRFVVRADTSGRVGAENFFLIDPKKLRDPTTGITPAKTSH